MTGRVEGPGSDPGTIGRLLGGLYGVVAVVGFGCLALPMYRMRWDLDEFDAVFYEEIGESLAAELGMSSSSIGTADLSLGFTMPGITWPPAVLVPVLLAIAAGVGLAAAVRPARVTARAHGLVAASVGAVLVYSLLALIRFPGMSVNYSGQLADEFLSAEQIYDTWVDMGPGLGLILVWTAAAVVTVVAAISWWTMRTPRPLAPAPARVPVAPAAG